MVSLDIRDIPGTNCYLDEISYSRVKDLVFELPLRDIHFMGSGNYHYLSYFFLGRVTSPFYLVLFDNHPDCQTPAFGDILSCGGWVKKALSDYSLLRKVFIVGASLEHIAEEEPFPEKVVIVPEAKDLPKIMDSALNCHGDYMGVEGVEYSGSVGVYISIDKDVLSSEYALTDWDQGKMSLSELCGCLEEIMSLVENRKSGEILGVDICGDSKSEPNGPDHYINHNSNIRILETLSRAFSTIFC